MKIFYKFKHLVLISKLYFNNLGKRSDLDALAEMAAEGKPIKAIAEANPSKYIMYYRGLHAYRSLFVEHRQWHTTCHVLWGPTGSGKTTKALEMCKKEEGDFFCLTRSMVNQSTIWWDGYDGQETIFIDEFYGWIPYSQFLVLIDQIPLTVQMKGGSRPFTSKKIIITSNQDPLNWYTDLLLKKPECVPAIKRRMTPPCGIVDFVGYGPNKDLKCCPCDTPKTCGKLHQEKNGPIALASGFQPAPIMSRVIRLALDKRQAEKRKNQSSD